MLFRPRRVDEHPDIGEYSGRGCGGDGGPGPRTPLATAPRVGAERPLLQGAIWAPCLRGRAAQRARTAHGGWQPDYVHR